MLSFVSRPLRWRLSSYRSSRSSRLRRTEGCGGRSRPARGARAAAAERARFALRDATHRYPGAQAASTRTISLMGRVARAPNARTTNLAPFARGNTPAPEHRRRGAPSGATVGGRAACGVAPESASGKHERREHVAAAAIHRRAGGGRERRERRTPARPVWADCRGARRPSRPITRGRQTFGNPSGGGGEFGPQIQFEHEGGRVRSLGPPVRRAGPAQLVILDAAMSMRGHVGSLRSTSQGRTDHGI